MGQTAGGSKEFCADAAINVEPGMASLPRFGARWETGTTGHTEFAELFSGITHGWHAGNYEKRFV